MVGARESKKQKDKIVVFFGKTERHISLIEATVLRDQLAKVILLRVVEGAQRLEKWLKERIRKCP